MGNLRMKDTSKLERVFQANIVKEIKTIFKDCIVLKLDPSHTQGIPDLLVLWKDRWAAIECKRSSKAKVQPNQKYYVDKMNKMSFARFLYPENKEEVIHDLQQSFKSKR